MAFQWLMPTQSRGHGVMPHTRIRAIAPKDRAVIVRLLAILGVLASSATARADLPPGAVLRLADDRLFVGSHFFPAVAFTPDGRHVLTCSTLAGTDVWDTTTGRRVRRLPGVGGFRLEVSPDGRWVAGSGGKEGAIMCDMRSGQVYPPQPPPPNEMPFRTYALAFTRDSACLVVVSPRVPGYALRVLEVPTGRELARATGVPMDITPLLVVGGADGRSVLLVIGNDLYHHELPALTPGRPPARIGRPPTRRGGLDGVSGSLSPHGRWAVTGPAAAGPMTVADAATGKTRWTEPVDAPSFLQFTADEQTMVILERTTSAPNGRDGRQGRAARLEPRGRAADLGGAV